MSIGTVIYGPRYCGKTSFAETIDKNVVWFSTIGNQDTWKDFKNIVETLTKKDKYIVIDGIGKMTDLCTDYICEQEDEEHPQLAGNRKSLIYRKIKEEAKDVFFALHENSEHVFYLAEMETKNLDSSLYKGTFMYPKFDWVLEDIMPHITQQTICMAPSYTTVKRKSKLTGDVELIRKEKRIMICSARPDIYAGDSTGKLPKEFDAGESGIEAYETYQRYMTKE